jgi:hypothetical protein
MLNSNGEHVTKDGRTVPLKDIGLNHLINIIKYIERRAKEGVRVVSACYGVDMMDMDFIEEVFHGQNALDIMNYDSYVNELKRRKIMTYEITSISRGGKRDILATFIAESYDLAMKHFTEWALGWLDEENNPESINAYEKLQSLYRDNEYMNSFLLDGVFYSFRENNNNEKFKFNCPHCGGHKVFGEKVSQWMRMEVTGIDKDGFVRYDYDNASFCADEGDDAVLFCDECFMQITEQEIIEQNKKGDIQ